MHERYDSTTPGADAGMSATAKETAKQASSSAKQTAQEVAGTAKEQGQRVAAEVGAQARSVVSDVRQSVTGQVRTGHGKLAEGVRRFADEVGGMAGGDAGSPASRVVQQLGHTGHRAADYLESRGPEGLLDDVQEFARRKPGTFLLAAAAAGFVIGRLGRSTIAAAKSDESTTPTGVYGSAGTYAGGYASTGYGTSAATLDDPYATGTYGTTAVGTASVDPAVGTGYDASGYPIDPVTTPDRGLAR